MIFLRFIGFILVVQGLPVPDKEAGTILELRIEVEPEANVNENLHRHGRDRMGIFSKGSDSQFVLLKNKRGDENPDHFYYPELTTERPEPTTKNNSTDDEEATRYIPSVPLIEAVHFQRAPSHIVFGQPRTPITSESTLEIVTSEPSPTPKAPIQYNASIVNDNITEVVLSEPSPTTEVPTPSNTTIANESDSTEPPSDSRNVIVMKLNVPRCPSILDITNASHAVTNEMRRAEGLKTGLGLVLNATTDSFSSVIGCLGKILADVGDQLMGMHNDHITKK